MMQYFYKDIVLWQFDWSKKRRNKVFVIKLGSFLNLKKKFLSLILEKGFREQ